MSYLRLSIAAVDIWLPGFRANQEGGVCCWWCGPGQGSRCVISCRLDGTNPTDNGMAYLRIVDDHGV
jgi:hypothetical protein